MGNDQSILFHISFSSELNRVWVKEIIAGLDFALTEFGVEDFPVGCLFPDQDGSS